MDSQVAELTMTGREHAVYRWLVDVLPLNAGLPAVTTYLASCNDAAWTNLIALVDSIQVIPACDWAQGSDFPDLTAIYFFLAWPVFPASLGAFVTRLWILGDHELIDRSVTNFELKFGFR